MATTTKNTLAADNQARSNPKVALSLDKQLYSDMINDAYNNSLKDIGSFRATILSVKARLFVDESTGERVTTVVDGYKPANYYEVMVRPEWLSATPAPWDFSDFQLTNTDTIQGEMALNAVEAHFEARSVSPSGNGQPILLAIGDVVICTFGDGMDNNGRARDIRFELNSVGRDNELIIAAGGISALQASRGKSGNLIGTPGAATGGKGDPGTFRWYGLHKGNPRAVGRPARRTYIGNAVPSLKGKFVYNGALPPEYFSSFQIQLYTYDSKGVAKPYKRARTFKICADAFSDFQNMNAAFKKEYGHDLPVSSINRTWQGQVATKDAAIIKNGGGFVAKPGSSKHGWGLAIDFKTESAKYNKNKKIRYESTTHVWLKENGHKWNWVNPDWAAKGKKQAEPWHFEWVPRDTVLEGEKSAKAWYIY